MSSAVIGVQKADGLTYRAFHFCCFVLTDSCVVLFGAITCNQKNKKIIKGIIRYCRFTYKTSQKSEREVVLLQEEQMPTAVRMKFDSKVLCLETEKDQSMPIRRFPIEMMWKDSEPRVRVLSAIQKHFDSLRRARINEIA